MKCYEKLGKSMKTFAGKAGKKRAGARSLGYSIKGYMMIGASSPI